MVRGELAPLLETGLDREAVPLVPQLPDEAGGEASPRLSSSSSTKLPGSVTQPRISSKSQSGSARKNSRAFSSLNSTALPLASLTDVFACSYPRQVFLAWGYNNDTSYSDVYFFRAVVSSGL